MRLIQPFLENNNLTSQNGSIVIHKKVRKCKSLARNLAWWFFVIPVMAACLWVSTWIDAQTISWAGG